MVEIHNYNGMIVHFDAKISVFKQSFSNKTEMWIDDDYKNEFIKYANLIEEYKPIFILVDTRKFNFSVAPKLQEWQVKKILPALNNVGVKKAAMLINEDIFTQVSIEQTMEEDANTHAWETKFFNEEKEAMEWLLK